MGIVLATGPEIGVDVEHLAGDNHQSAQRNQE